MRKPFSHVRMVRKPAAKASLGDLPENIAGVAENAWKSRQKAAGSVRGGSPTLHPTARRYRVKVFAGHSTAKRDTRTAVWRASPHASRAAGRYDPERGRGLGTFLPLAPLGA